MSERDEKVIAAMKRYDSCRVGSSERRDAWAELEKIAAGISPRDFYRIAYEYEKRIRGAA